MEDNARQRSRRKFAGERKKEHKKKENDNERYERRLGRDIKVIKEGERERETKK